MKKFMAAGIIALCSFGAVASTASVGPPGPSGAYGDCTVEKLSSWGRSGSLGRTVRDSTDILPDKGHMPVVLYWGCVSQGDG